MLNLSEFCHQGAKAQYEFSLAQMDRLGLGVDAQVAAQYCAYLSLQGEIDAEGRLVLLGALKAKVPVYCQRCSKPFDYEISSQFCMSPVVDSEAAKALPAAYEPLIAPEGQVDLSTLVEDELILSLPHSPKHDLDECAQKQRVWRFGEDEAQPETPQVENPFAALKKLKQKQ